MAAKSMGEKIRVARENMNLSQKELADAIGVSQGCISRWENSTIISNIPSTLQETAEFLGIPLEDFIAIRDQHLTEVATTFCKQSKAKEDLLNIENQTRYFVVSEAELIEGKDIIKSRLEDSSAPGNSTALSDKRQILAKNLKYYMERNGVSGKKVCDDLGINYTTFSSWTRAISYPHIEKIVELANYFCCEATELVEEVALRFPQTPFRLNSDTFELIELYTKCNHEQKQCVKQLMKYLAASRKKI
jgi:transcriptional regulator with XRE-family HTH domain